MNQTIYRVYQGFAWVVFVGLVLQFFLAGIGVFEEGNFGLHRTVGELLIYASIVLLILAGASFVTGNPGGRWKVGLAALLFVLMLLQYLLVLDSLQESAPAISALHPVNGLLLLAVSYALARGLPRVTRPGSAEGTPTGTSRVR